MMWYNWLAFVFCGITAVIVDNEWLRLLNAFGSGANFVLAITVPIFNKIAKLMEELKETLPKENEDVRSYSGINGYDNAE